MNVNAVVFPGQGSQKRNMAMDFCESYEEAAEVFAQAKQSIDFDVKQVITEDEDRLDLTPYTQPCILAAEIAMFRVLQAQANCSANLFAGHSLGEYSALVAAEVMPLDLGLKLVRRRGELMQNAMPVGKGTMAAVMIKDLPYDQVKAIATEHQVDLANHNSLDQVVLSGLTAHVEAVVEQLSQQYGDSIRCVMLNVSAPFHSRHMHSISDEFQTVLAQYQRDYDIQQLPKVLSNYSGTFYEASSEQLIDYLCKQLYSEVKWQTNMEQLAAKTTDILELGPNRPLKRFFQAMGVKITAVCTLSQYRKAFEVAV